MHLYDPHPELCVARLASGPSNMDTRFLLWAVSPCTMQSPLILWLFLDIAMPLVPHQPSITACICDFHQNLHSRTTWLL